MIKDLTYLIMFLEDPSCCSVGNGLEKDNSRKTTMIILGNSMASWTRIVVSKWREVVTFRYTQLKPRGLVKSA